MTWHIDFSKDALKFLRSNNLKEDFVIVQIKRVIQKFKGENVNVDIKKLSGEWKGFYRIRSGRLRIIIEFQFERFRAYIEKIDWRGNVYK